MDRSEGDRDFRPTAQLDGGENAFVARSQPERTREVLGVRLNRRRAAVGVSERGGPAGNKSASPDSTHDARGQLVLYLMLHNHWRYAEMLRDLLHILGGNHVESTL